MQLHMYRYSEMLANRPTSIKKILNVRVNGLRLIIEFTDLRPQMCKNARAFTHIYVHRYLIGLRAHDCIINAT